MRLLLKIPGGTFYLLWLAHIHFISDIAHSLPFRSYSPGCAFAHGCVTFW